MLAVIGIFRGVKPEAVHPQVQPVDRHVQHSLPYLLVVKIEFRHPVGEIGFHLQGEAAEIPEAPAGRRGCL